MNVSHNNEGRRNREDRDRHGYRAVMFIGTVWAN